MDHNLTDIVVVLDRSGSMASVVDDTIGGFNAFVDRQKQGEGRARLTLVEFDHEYEVVCERKEIDEVSHLDHGSYVPRGNTALLDAIGRTIVGVRGAIAVDRPSEHPARVVFVIVTDGMENASSEFTRSQILEMIRAHQENGWEFLSARARTPSGKQPRWGSTRHAPPPEKGEDPPRCLRGKARPVPRSKGSREPSTDSGGPGTPGVGGGPERAIQLTLRELTADVEHRQKRRPGSSKADGERCGAPSFPVSRRYDRSAPLLTGSRRTAGIR